jgi:hypothetical protein
VRAKKHTFVTVEWVDLYLSLSLTLSLSLSLLVPLSFARISDAVQRHGQPLHTHLRATATTTTTHYKEGEDGMGGGVRSCA